MPFEAKVNPESLINNLRDLYGNKITSAHIKAYCAQHDVTYQTVTKYLQQFKTTKGKWNLTAMRSYAPLWALPLNVPPPSGVKSLRDMRGYGSRYALPIKVPRPKGPVSPYPGIF